MPNPITVSSPTRVSENTGVSLRRAAVFAAVMLLAACHTDVLGDPSRAGTAASTKNGTAAATVVNVSNDTTAQNETPLAANPLNSLNMITGANDWNHNDGCAVNATFRSEEHTSELQSPC